MTEENVNSLSKYKYRAGGTLGWFVLALITAATSGTPPSAPANVQVARAEQRDVPVFGESLRQDYQEGEIPVVPV